MDTDKAYQMVRVAELYYEQGLNQSRIAKIMGCSASTVSRLLADAHQQGIIEVIIHRPVLKLPELSRLFRETFGLREGIVVASGQSYEEDLKNVGAAAAELLRSVLRDGDTLGMSWGNTLYHTINALNETRLENIEVVQVLGGLGQGDPRVDGPELALRMAQKLNGRYRYINAPAIVESIELRDQIAGLSAIREVIDRASHARVMICGVGALKERMSSLVRTGYLSDEDFDTLVARGAVGHVNARIIDVNGSLIDHPYNEQVIGAPLEALREAEWSIGIAASTQKAEAILAALNGRYYNAFVTDANAARAVLRLAGVELPEAAA